MLFIKRPTRKPEPKRRGPVSPYRDQIVKLYHEGKSISQIADQLGCNYSTASRHLREAGLNCNTRCRPIDVDKLKALYQEGLKTSDIAKSLNCDYSTVYKYLKRNGCLTNDQLVSKHRLQAVKELADQGKTRPEIAVELGLNYNSLCTFMRVHHLQAKNVYGDFPIPDTEVGKITSLVEQGWLQREIGEIYGVDQKTVSEFMVNNNILANCGRGRTRPSTIPKDRL